MEKNSNPAALTPQAVDQEAFDRVWRRVMPDQAQSHRHRAGGSR